MYEILEHRDHIKAVKEMHDLKLDSAYADGAMRIAIGLGAVLVGISALIASIRF